MMRINQDCPNIRKYEIYPQLIYNKMDKLEVGWMTNFKLSEFEQPKSFSKFKNKFVTKNGLDVHTLLLSYPKNNRLVSKK